VSGIEGTATICGDNYQGLDWVYTTETTYNITAVNNGPVMWDARSAEFELLGRFWVRFTTPPIPAGHIHMFFIDEFSLAQEDPGMTLDDADGAGHTERAGHLDKCGAAFHAGDDLFAVPNPSTGRITLVTEGLAEGS
jgi:hypothetical protein